jgi:hypothetical protein
MDLSALNDYRQWINRTPFEVHLHAINHGGWRNVFRGKMPRWASRVRNYFNLTPRKLTRLNGTASATYLKEAQKAIVAADCAQFKRLHDDSPAGKAGIKRDLPKGCPAEPDPKARMDFSDTMGTRNALSGDVYMDELRQIWFQMDPGGAIYHYGEKPWWPTGEAIYASTQKGQKMVPVFKLVSPDGTGGSRECCIKNPMDVPFKIAGVAGKFGQSNIGAINEEVDVSGRIVSDPVQEGSYNYAETVDQGLAAHQRLDVDTDLMLPTFFVDPPDRFSQLLFRRFPERKDGESTPLADQVKY